MAKISIPPVKLPWREKDIQSGDHKLLADYLKVLVKTLQKKLEEIGSIINVNADNTGDMLKDDYDPDNDGKVENADHADNADFATNSDKVDNKDATDFINIDGSTSPTTDIDWGGHKITNLGSPTDILDAVNEEYLAKAVSTIGSRYYMTDDDSGIEDYKLCSINPSSSSEQSILATDVVDGQYIGGWISPNTGEPSRLLIGVFNWRIYVEKTGGNKTLRLYWKLIERRSDNSEVVIGTSIVSNEIITEKNSYIIPLTLDSDYEIAPDSYIVGKIYVSVTGNGNNPSLKIYYQGNSASHFQIPVNTEILDNRFLSKEVYDPDGDGSVKQADNADKVDNFDASQTPQANTIPVAGSDGKLDEGWLPDTSSSAEDVSYDNTSSGLSATNVQDAIDEVEGRVDDIENGTTTVGNADKLDNEDGSFYRNASNLNAGIVPRARLDGTYDIDITGDANTLQGKDPSDFASSTHTHTLENLSNVNILSPNDGQALVYDSNNNIWKNGDVSSGGGGDMYKSIYDPDDDGKVENADNADKLQNHPVSDFALLDEDNTFNGKQTVNGEIKHSYNGANPDTPPDQITPIIAKLGTAGSYNIDGTGNIFHLMSYAENFGSRPVVAVFGEGEALQGDSQAWGGNFVAYAKANGASAHGVEINFGTMASGGNAYGLLIVSTGSYRTKRFISLHSNSNGVSPSQGIWFAKNGSVNPIDTSGTLFGTDPSISANIGIDLSGVTFGLTAIRLPNNENISGLTSSGSTRQILKISSDNYIHIGDTSGYQGIAFYPGSANTIIFTSSGDIHLPGKLTSDGGNDPAYVLYDYQTRESLIKRIKEEIPPSKLNGAVLFYNGDAEQLEVFIPKKGKFIDLTGKVLETVDPITETFEVEKEYFFDKNTGEIRCIEIKKRKKEYRLKDGYQIDKKTGKIIKICPKTKDVLKVDVPKEEAVEEIFLE